MESCEELRYYRLEVALVSINQQIVNFDNRKQNDTVFLYLLKTLHLHMSQNSFYPSDYKDQQQQQQTRISISSLSRREVVLSLWYGRS